MGTKAGGVLSALTSPGLEPFFWPPSRLGAMSAWWGHVPFAHWLVTALRPGVVVELGTRDGVSFAAFCEAMRKGEIAGRCYAIETWRGDRHSGSYDDSVSDDLSSFVAAHYPTLAQRLRCPIEEALPSFDDGSIDLLHIEGLQSYEAVSAGFERWRPKLSPRATVLIHDTRVRSDDCGVRQFWAELCERYPSFECPHSSGLGVAAIGGDVPQAVADLCSLDQSSAAVLQDRFAQLGAGWVAADRAERASRDARNLATERTRQVGVLEGRIADRDSAHRQMTALASEHLRRIAELERERDQAAELSATQFRSIAALETERARDTDLILTLREQREQRQGLFAPLLRRLGGTRPRPALPVRHRQADAALAPGDPAAMSEARTIAASGLFDASFYAGAAEADAMGLGPIEHYLERGEAAGLKPSARFDPDFYRERYPDIAAPGTSPLLDYIAEGWAEGRSGVPVAASLAYPISRLRSDRETVAVAVHEASRTGAPIIAWNLVRALEQRYNVVALLKRGGPIEEAFTDLASATITLPDGIEWRGAESRALAAAIVRTYAPKYLVANSVETRAFVPAFERAGVATVALIHEFSSYTRPRGTLDDLYRTASAIVFPAQIVADESLADYRSLRERAYTILPQGRCLPPMVRAEHIAPPRMTGDLSRLPARDGSAWVIGIGTAIPRKGVEFFLAAAASVVRRRTRRRITFAWVGQYEGLDDHYLESLRVQVRRSGLDSSFVFLGEFEDVTPIYERADMVFLSSRLDPFPNVALDAIGHGVPLVCFDQASGFAELLAQQDATRPLVVPYLDAEAAADAILALAEDPVVYGNAVAATKAIAARHVDTARYAEAIDGLGCGAVRLQAQAQRDREVIEAHEAFNPHLFLGRTVDDPAEGLDEYLGASRCMAPRGRPSTGLYLRRPLDGFHPLIYAACNERYGEASGEDPLAHYARTGFPAGPWRHRVIRPGPESSPEGNGLRVAVHGHFYYPEVLPDFIERLRRNRTQVDLLVTTVADQAETVAGILRQGAVPRATVRIVPNRGRDIGPLLTALGPALLRDYDVVAHVHSKRSLHAGALTGERWRGFLWETTVGGRHAMMDTVLAAFASDDQLGLVFPEEPNLLDWEGNRSIAEGLAARMGLPGPLPTHFDFPMGTMFWARPAALAPLFDLALDWDDYPPEPVPIDGTLLHAIERLLPFSAAKAGYGYATTYVDTVMR